MARHPISEFAIKRRLVIPGTAIKLSGEYGRADGHLYISRGRPRGGWGQAFDRGETVSIAMIADNKLDYLKRVLVHELGHLVYWSSGKAVRDLVDKHFSPSNGLTYLARRRLEYLPECLLAYVHEPELLVDHDPEGYKMVVAVLKHIRAGEQTDGG